MSDNITIGQLQKYLHVERNDSLRDTINDLKVEIESKTKRVQQLENELKETVINDEIPIIGSWFINNESSSRFSLYYIISKGDIYQELPDITFKVLKFSLHTGAAVLGYVYSIHENCVVSGHDIGSSRFQLITKEEARSLIEEHFTHFFENVMKLVQGL